MPTVNRILETVLYVADLDVAADFYRDLFQFPLLLDDSRLKALQVGDNQVLLLFQKKMSVHPTVLPQGVIPPHDGDGPGHIAFSIAAAELDDWKKLLQSKGIAIESEVAFEKATSIYFRDTDNHLVELAPPAIWGLH